MFSFEHELTVLIILHTIFRLQQLLDELVMDHIVLLDRVILSIQNFLVVVIHVLWHIVRSVV